MEKPQLPDVNLLFLLRGHEVLLAMKKRRFGAGWWNGVGGKLEPGESIAEAAVRETREEIGVTVTLTDLKPVAVLEFRFPENKAGFNQRVHVFTATNWQGEPGESEEMRPQWFPQDQLPFDQMWPDDRFWLPLVLDHQFVKGQFWFDDEGGVRKHQLDTRRL